MLHALGLNFKIGLKFLWRFLIIVFVVNLANGSPRAAMLVWPVKILIFFLLLGWWFRKIKKEDDSKTLPASEEKHGNTLGFPG